MPVPPGFEGIRGLETDESGVRSVVHLINDRLIVLRDDGTAWEGSKLVSLSFRWLDEDAGAFIIENVGVVETLADWRDPEEWSILNASEWEQREQDLRARRRWGITRQSMPQG